nr:probable elongation factor 1-beta [Leptinotarsa decemlineata]
MNNTDGVWITRKIYEDAEVTHFENLAKAALTPLAGEVAKARQRLIESRDTFTSSLASIDIGAIKFIEKKVVEFEKCEYMYAFMISKYLLFISEPALIAKSNIILDVKPWDDETDMKAMEENVRKIEADGLLWGAAKLVPLAYGIKKLQISCVVEDDKVSIDWLTETLQELEEYVQSVDIAAFNKI